MSAGELVIALELALLVGGMFAGKLRGPVGPQGFTGERGEDGYAE